MSKQTAVEWLVEQFNLQSYLPHIEQAKQMEKEQIIDSYEQGDKYKLNFSGEQFYNETYGGSDE
jgi:hypothetical protein